MRYIPNTPEDKEEMLKAIGAGDFGELISSIPDALLLKAPLDLPPALSEHELLSEMEAMAKLDADSDSRVCFLGGGAYDHFIPSVVGHIASRSEFYTSYTPYQAEVSQGTLQAAFEYQTMVCELTGMGAANASMYDGASAMAEAALMAQRLTKRDETAVSMAVHPNYRKTLRTYLRGIKAGVLEIPYHAGEGTTDLTALAGALAVLEEHGYVAILAVAERAEGQGVGRGLLAAAEEWGRAEGYRRLTLSASSWNHSIAPSHPQSESPQRDCVAKCRRRHAGSGWR